MNKLPENFSFDRYGLHVRFVCEEDAEFITQIRTNDRNARYIHSTDQSVEKQLAYIQAYKAKEAKGDEYYFMFLIGGERQGVYRIYNRHEDWCTTGSFVFKRDAVIYAAARASVITHELVFSMLGHDKVIDVDGTHIDNKAVLLLEEMIGGRHIGEREDEKGTYIVWELHKEVFLSRVPNVLRLTGYRK